LPEYKYVNSRYLIPYVKEFKQIVKLIFYSSDFRFFNFIERSWLLFFNAY